MRPTAKQVATAAPSGMSSRSGVDRLGRDRVKEVDAWDEDDLRKFLAVAKDHRWGASIRLAAPYGLRRSELIGLQLADIDLNAMTVRIERGLVPESTTRRGSGRWGEMN